MVLALYLAFLFWHIDAARDAWTGRDRRVAPGSESECWSIVHSIILATAVSSIAKVKYNLSK
jgi:hypothetical protein